MQEMNIDQTSKKLTLILTINAVLIIAVAVLYVLFFMRGEKTEQKSGFATDKSGSDLRIAFVYSDTILSRYSLAIAKTKELETRSNLMESELRTKQEQYQKDVAYFQEQVNNNQLSDQSAQFIYGQLMEEQQRLYELEQKYASELEDLQIAVNIMLLDSVTNFLERYNQKMGFDFILGHNAMSSLLLKNEKFDITEEVITGLNNDYEKPTE
jgi:outer membrane protein